MFLRERMSPLDVLRLRALVAATKQDHNLRPTMHIIDAVARTIVDPHFHDSAADAPGVSGIAPLHAAQASDDPCCGLGIFKTVQPVRKFRGLAHFDHDGNVAHRLQTVKFGSMALGLDRLVMLATGASRIDQVLWAPIEEAPK